MLMRTRMRKGIGSQHYTAMIAAAASAVMLTACTSTPKSDARLETARATFSTLQAQGNVGVAAPIELKDAQDALSRADEALVNREDSDVIEHRIYLAQQRVAIAQQAYKSKVAEQSLKQLNDNRDKLRLDARTAEVERTKQELKDLQAKMTERGMVMTLGDVLFDVGKSTLKPGAMRSIDKLASYLQANPQRTVAIEGFTDSTGSDELNQRLSEERAQSVKAALAGSGVNGDRITTRGYGEGYPVAGNDSSSGRQLNRRVEIILSDESGNVAPRG